MSDKKPTGLDLLRQPFPAHQISKLPKPTSKDGKKAQCAECGSYHAFPAIHLDYVGHAALTDRLLDADPSWSWEPLAFTSDGLPLFDESGGLWIKLTVCGLTRLGYGNAASKFHADVGAREKEVIGDALRNAAMRFGAALDLWHKGQLHEAEVPEAPEGYVEWKAKTAPIAAGGGELWAKAWKTAPVPFRNYLTQHDAETLTAWKDEAEKARGAA